MSHANNGSVGIHDGENCLAAPPRILILGFYDGPTNGVIQFGDGGPVFEFKWVDEDASAARTFSLARLPSGALDRLTATIAPHIEPTWPVWFPVWRFASKEVQLAVEAVVDAVLADAVPCEWHVTPTDHYSFRVFRAERVPVARPA
jgi:hypothetical protein